MLMWALLVALGTMLVFPDTQIARVLRLWLVEKPAAWLAGLTAAKLLKWLLVAPIVMALVLTSPELLPLLATLGDAGLVLELLLALWMAAVVSDARAIRNRIAGLVAAVARLGRLVAPRPRAPRAKRRPRPAKPADSGDEPGFGLAFA